MADVKVNVIRKDKKAEVKEGIKQKKKIPLWIIVVALAQPVMGGVGFFAVKTIKAKAEQEKAEREEARKKAAEENNKDNIIKISLPSFSVNIQDPEKGLRRLDIEMAFDIGSKKTADEFQSKRIIIRDDLILLLSSKQIEEVESLEARKKLQSEIITRINRLLTSGTVEMVYFTDFLLL